MQPAESCQQSLKYVYSAFFAPGFRSDVQMTEGILFDGLFSIRFFCDGPCTFFGFPMKILYFRSIIPWCMIKRPAFSSKEKADIRDNASAGHWIKDKIAGFCKIEQCVCNQLGRYPPWPVVPESYITFVEIPLVP